MNSRELQLHFDLQALDDSINQTDKAAEKPNNPKQIEVQDKYSKQSLVSELENSPTPKQTKHQQQTKIYSNDKDKLYFQRNDEKTNAAFGSAEMQQRIQLAEELKKKGNYYYADKNFEEAISQYTEALELVQDSAVLLLNRAIAYIKIYKFQQAIVDCSKFLEIAQNKEERFTQSIDSFFKAHLRRALAYYKTGQLQKALQDVEQAIQIDPNDKEAQRLKDDVKHYLNIEFMDKQNKTDSKECSDEPTEVSLEAQQISQRENSLGIQVANSGRSSECVQTSMKCKFQQNYLNYKDVIDGFLIQNQNYDLYQVLKVMMEYTDESAAYFYDKRGIETLIQIIKADEEFLHDQFNFMASLPALILQSYQEQNQLYQEQFILQYNGVDIIIQKIIKLLNKAKQKKKSAIFDCIRDYIEAINIMNEEKTRILIQSSPHIITTLYPEIFVRILSLSETEPELVSSFLSLCANLCYDQSSFLRQIFLNHLDQIVDQISQIYQNVELSIQSCDMYVQILNLLSNLLIEDQFRKKFLDQTFNKEFYIQYFRLLKQLQINLDPNYDELISIALGFLINLFHQLNAIQSEQLILELKQLPKILEAFSSSRNSLILERVEIVQASLNLQKEPSIINLKFKVIGPMKNGYNFH
ncbi:unnamed protein product (macronuclear) [Paramecium tetraurelia]|uniref:Uncharacterized protein n=1 Tax=Paramecium tetraurelia TaxID=5888 RepID=A0CC54_PARTE|nr:uncharacterized protein GSPATT00037155001 [Paramecium tetraurelia]CAK68371.1 unnamed protein product [Paramecium tetraurelia]|eukprot:XP_001435768.1 hypothetical protein (macronuclear) [Paramecium tetraurelia strain d4-2]